MIGSTRPSIHFRFARDVIEQFQAHVLQQTVVTLVDHHNPLAAKTVVDRPQSVNGPIFRQSYGPLRRSAPTVVSQYYFRWSAIVSGVEAGRTLQLWNSTLVDSLLVVQLPLPGGKIDVGGCVESIQFVSKLVPVVEDLFDDLAPCLLLGGTLVQLLRLEGPEDRQQGAADAEEKDGDEAIDGGTTAVAKDPPRHAASTVPRPHPRHDPPDTDFEVLRS